MSTCLDIVRRALRLTEGETGVPTGLVAQDALQRLQSVILDLPGLLKNAAWRDRFVSAAYTAKEGDRVSVTAPGSVTLPAIISDCGSQRLPLDCARVQIIGAASNAGLWLYSASKGAWGKCNGLSLTSESPFGDEDDEGLAALLAVALVDEYGGEISAATVSTATAAKASLRSRLKKCALRDCSQEDYV